MEFLFFSSLFYFHGVGRRRCKSSAIVLIILFESVEINLLFDFNKNVNITGTEEKNSSNIHVKTSRLGTFGGILWQFSMVSIPFHKQTSIGQPQAIVLPADAN